MHISTFSKKSRFISVEIFIRTNADAVEFVKWFEDQDNYVCKVPSDSEKWYIYCDPISGSNADEVISNLCQMVEDFPKGVRQDWDQAERREFYAGYNVGDKPFCFTEDLHIDTLKSAIRVNAGIGYALYPAEPTDEDGCPERISNKN